MTWVSFILSLYLLGIFATAVLIHRPMSRALGTDTAGAHSSADDARGIDAVVVALVFGFAALWPLTLSAYAVRRALRTDDAEDDYGVMVNAAPTPVGTE